MRALKHIDWACEEEESEAVSKLVNRGVAIEGFFVMIGSISSDVRTGGFANLNNRGLRTYEKGTQLCQRRPPEARMVGYVPSVRRAIRLAHEQQAAVKCRETSPSFRDPHQV